VKRRLVERRQKAEDRRQKSEVRRLEGWRVSKSEGVKDSRIQGVEWFSWYLFFKT